MMYSYSNMYLHAIYSYDMFIKNYRFMVNNNFIDAERIKVEIHYSDVM